MATELTTKLIKVAIHLPCLLDTTPRTIVDSRATAKKDEPSNPFFHVSSQYNPNSRVIVGGEFSLSTVTGSYLQASIIFSQAPHVFVV